MVGTRTEQTKGVMKDGASATLYGKRMSEMSSESESRGVFCVLLGTLKMQCE